VIVRVSTEGQYELSDGALTRMQELDQECQAAVDAGDSTRFHARYAELLSLIRDQGSELADDDLRGSDLTLPPPDITLEEAQSEFSAHGLIPD
jgi:PspA-Associated protein